MRKSIFMGLALIAALAFVSCKSSESSYKKAYEKAKAQEMAQTNTTDQVETAPVSVTPVVTTPVTAANTENDRQERLTVMNGGTLKAFNVVCGSFSNVDNANNSLPKVTLHKWHRTLRPTCTVSSPHPSTTAQQPFSHATSFVAPTPTHGSSIALTNDIHINDTYI